LTKVKYFGKNDAGGSNVFDECSGLNQVTVTGEYIGSTFCGKKVVIKGDDDWEVHIEFQNLNLSASEVNTSDLLNTLHEMSGIDVSNMMVEVQSDDNGMVSGVNIYVTEEISASDLMDILNGCSSQNSCRGILQYVSSVSLSRNNLFNDEGNLLVGMMNMIVMSLIITIMFF